MEPAPMNRSQPLLSINAGFVFGPIFEGVDSEDDRRDIKVAKDRVDYADLLGFRPDYVCKRILNISFANDPANVEE